MGVCCDNSSGSKKFKIKVKRKRKHKSKDKVQDMNFEIIDVSQNKTHQILSKTNKTLRELLTQADFNLNGDFDIQLKNGENISDELNTNLKDIIDAYYPDLTLLSVTILVNNKGLSIPSNIKKAYEENTPIIGSAIFDDKNKFGLSMYHKDKKILETFFFDKTQNEIIKKFNSYSAYCSAQGVFYISGGEREGEPNNEDETEKEVEFFGNFIAIDMNKLELGFEKDINSNNSENNLPIKKLPSLNMERSWHSMIYVPNKYIFIIGGTNTKIVERYDIEKNELKYDSELKEKRCEPALCLVNNNYLYAFCGFNPFKDFNNNIERCDLLKKKREWEFIGCSSSISASFFGISFFKDNQILLISPKDNIEDENKNYTIKIGNDDDSPDEINETVLQYNGIRTFKDKLFYPMFDNFCVNIPMNIGKYKSVLILDIDTGNIECKNYK
jgi:hypothetical protein